jgi:hypothetical protein
MNLSGGQQNSSTGHYRVYGLRSSQSKIRRGFLLTAISAGSPNEHVIPAGF